MQRALQLANGVAQAAQAPQGLPPEYLQAYQQSMINRPHADPAALLDTMHNSHRNGLAPVVLEPEDAPHPGIDVRPAGKPGLGKGSGSPAIDMQAAEDFTKAFK